MATTQEHDMASLRRTTRRAGSCDGHDDVRNGRIALSPLSRDMDLSGSLSRDPSLMNPRLTSPQDNTVDGPDKIVDTNHVLFSQRRSPDVDPTSEWSKYIAANADRTAHASQPQHSQAPTYFKGRLGSGYGQSPILK